MLGAVYEETVESRPVRVSASVPLLRAGLERAVGAAGLRPAGPGERAQIRLHAEDTPPDDGVALDVDASPDHITVTVRRDLGVDTWHALYPLVTELLDPPK